MMNELKRAVVAVLVLTVLTGLVYPLAVTAAAQLLFPAQANGSLLPGGRGSELIGQSFDSPAYFWGRLSASGYDASASGGTNLAMTNPALVEAARARIQALHAADPPNTAPIPVDLATASGSGLDPHISPAAAEYQADRVARARGMDPVIVRQLVADYTVEVPVFLLGEPHVNVVLLNAALDRGEAPGTYASTSRHGQETIGSHWPMTTR